MNNQYRNRLLSQAIAIATATTALQIAPEAGAQALEEVIVTASRRAESLQDIPINITALSGDQIHVARGTYFPDDADSSFFLPTDVSLFGGYPTGGGARNPSTNPTILSGDVDHDDANADERDSQVKPQGYITAEGLDYWV